MAKKSKKSAPTPKPAKKEKPAPKGTRGMRSGSPSPTSSSPSPARKPIAPAPKVLVVSADDKDKALRIPSLLGTIYTRKAAAVSRRKNAHSERDDLHNQMAELGKEAWEKKHPKYDDYLLLRKRHGEVLDEIKDLADTISGCDSTYDRIAQECSEGRLAFAEMTLEDLIEESAKPAEKGDQMTLDQAAPKDPPGAGSSWRKIIAFKDFFDGKPEKDVRAQFAKIEDLRFGVMPVDNPLVLAGYIRFEFERISAKDSSDATKQRESILPAAPEWFIDGLWRLMDDAVRADGEIHDPENEAHSTDSESTARNLADAARRDPHAWCNLIGGSDAPVNKAVLAFEE